MPEPSLRISLPPFNRPEREYTCRLIFEERLGVRCEFEDGCTGTTILTHAGRRLMVPDLFFQGADHAYADSHSFPGAPTRLDPSPIDESYSEADVVAMFPTLATRSVAEIDSESISLSFDLLGGVFLMLTRFEESFGGERDQHGRFPSDASWLVRHGLERRPIVDEYVALVRACCERLWPGMTRRAARYRLAPSHDIDHPFLYHGLPRQARLRRLARKVVGDLSLRRSPAEALRSVGAYLDFEQRGPAADPYFTLTDLMNESERRGLQSTFYFIVRPSLEIDGRPYIDDQQISTIVRQIVQRGHRLGLHASYASWRDPSRASAEAVAFQSYLERLGLGAEPWGIRHHYLRWSAPEHWAMWDDVGAQFDATLGYSDRIGFRCGTSHEYPVFDLTRRRQLGLRERPLQVMDSALCADADVRSAPARRRALEQLETVSRRCREHDGTLELLWHNTHLQSEAQKQFYGDALDVCLRTN